MTTDRRNQAGWLADAGYLAAAPDLYHRGGRLRCMFATIRDAARRSGPAFDDLDAVRSWLAARDDCTDRVGVIGFCMGGGFALLLAAARGYDASSVTTGSLLTTPWSCCAAGVRSSAASARGTPPWVTDLGGWSMR